MSLGLSKNKTRKTWATAFLFFPMCLPQGSGHEKGKIYDDEEGKNLIHLSEGEEGPSLDRMVRKGLS